MDKRERLDNLIRLVKESGGHSYWCKWCNRHIQPDPESVKNLKNGGSLLFIHDDVYHPPNYVFESGDEHIVH